MYYPHVSPSGWYRNAFNGFSDNVGRAIPTFCSGPGVRTDNLNRRQISIPFSNICIGDTASRIVIGFWLAIRPGDGNVLRDSNTHEVDHEQESIDDTEEFEGGAVKVCQEDGETEGKEQACDQRHEGQPPAELLGGFPADLF